MRIVGVENHGMQTDMDVNSRIIVSVRIELLGNVITAVCRFGQCPNVIAQNINNARVLRVDYEAVVVESIATIQGMALVVGHRREGNRPIGTAVFGNIDTSVVAVGIDAGGIDDIVRRIGYAVKNRGNGNVKNFVGLGKQGVALKIGARARMANHIVDIGANIKLTVNSGSDSVVFRNLHFAGFAFDGHLPGLTFVGGILQALIGGSQNDVACNSHVVDEIPLVSRRSHHLGHGIIVSGINGPNASANEAVVIILLVEAVVGSGRATITRADINQAVGILGHATDQQVLIANLMPGHTVVVGFVDTTTH